MADKPLQAEIELTTLEEPTYVVHTVHEAIWPHHSILLLFTLLWGGNFVLAEVALREMEPISFSVARFLMGGAAMLAILYWQSRSYARKNGSAFRLFPQLDKGDWPRLLLISVIGATLAPWLGIEGLDLTHGARASLWLALGPVLSVGIGALLRTERLGWMGYVGVILTGLGTLALAVDGLNPERNYWVGDLLLFMALLMAVAELHLIKPLATRYGATPVVTARTLIGGFFYLLIATKALVGEPWLSLSAWAWVAILAGGAIGVGVGQWVKVRALRTLGPTRVVLYGNLVPVAAMVLAWLALSTVPSVLETLAAALIILGAVSVQMLDTYTHPTDTTTAPS
ncbi:MAG: DMT family transporter [Rhodothermales bacterium]